MTDFLDRRITKKNLSEHFSLSLSTTRRTLKAIGADLKSRTYDSETLADFIVARQLFQKGWSQKKVLTFFNLRNTTRDISNH